MCIIIYLFCLTTISSLSVLRRTVTTHFLNSLGVSEFKLPRAVAEEVSIDPGGNGALYFSSDGLGGLLH